ncbi:MAG: putative peptidase (M48 family) [Candidatus Collierbacteria bacterium GW2011_GWA1_44_12]|uniref:Putative peptidase (M48 family) n=1 Tax=Candidatus Collierbacteria bacterium GW2011_GWA1_44_12 TaxID=1618376 RepID=A0A0G1JHM0_9BACT|nr:MAG: putative peptidase (M48 family) [Candidatus Collierbacteria bacterium GW2011_GWA1_44_12]
MVYNVSVDQHRRESVIEPWMFRSNNEYPSLFISLFLSLVIGAIFSLLDFWIFLLVVVSGLIFIRLQQYSYLGDSIRVHENQFPEIYETFTEYARKLKIARGNIYIKQDPYLNAWTLGFFTCTVVLTSALVEQLTDEEIKFVIAHELGHFKAGHTKVTSLISPLGTNNPFANLIFGFYTRQSEYTSDRCGLALTSNIDSAISSMIKIAIGGSLFKKMKLEGYMNQLKIAQGMGIRMGEILSSHPLTTNRVKSLANFWNNNFISGQNKHEMQ